MREIAKQAGVSPRSLYKYFPNKEQLLVSVANERLGQMIVGLNQHISGVRGSLSKLSKMTAYYLSTLEDDKQTAWVLYVTTNLTSWRRSSKAWRNLKSTAGLLRNIIEEGQATGEVRQDIDIHAVTDLYFGGLRHLVAWWLVNRQTWSLASKADALTETIFNAIKTAPQPATPFICPFAKDIGIATVSSVKAQSRRINRTVRNGLRSSGKGTGHK